MSTIEIPMPLKLLKMDSTRPKSHNFKIRSYLQVLRDTANAESLRNESHGHSCQKLWGSNMYTSYLVYYAVVNQIQKKSLHTALSCIQLKDQMV